MDLSGLLAAIGLSSIITLVITKVWDLWREKEKTKNEDRKLLRKALSNLTNLWQSLLTWDFEDQLNITNSLLLEQFANMGANPDKLLELKIKDSDKNKVISVQTRTATEKLKSLDDQLSVVVDRLSEIRPLIASEIYELQSNTPLQSIEKVIEEQLKDGKKRSQIDFNMIYALQNRLFQEYKQNLIKRIKPFILIIAEQIDKETLKSATEHLEERERMRAELIERKDPENEKNSAKRIVEMLIETHLKVSNNSLSDESNENKNNLEK